MSLKPMPTKSLIAVTVAIAAASLIYSAPETFSPISEAQGQTLASLPDFTKLVEENGKAVVSIQVTKKLKRPAQGFHGFEGLPKEHQDMLKRFGFPFGGEIPFGNPHGEKAPKRTGQGSGFIISPDGIILTNHHVVNGADEIKVHLPDKRDFTAKILGTDEKTDIAVIKIDGTDLPVVKLGQSKDVKVGEWVAAIGAPFGLENTVTQGIVSAISRDLPGDQYVPFIQTDAAVNPGNSGGPLFNMKGEVIGINSQIFSTSGGFMGLSFAIPIDEVLQIKDELIKDGKVTRGRIGVMIQNMDEDLAKSFGLEKPEGALVVELEKDGPAEKAGIQEGDIITEFNGTQIKEFRDLSRVVASNKPGESVPVKVIRNGEQVQLNVTIGGSNDAKEETKESAAPAANNVMKQLGVSFRPLNEEEKKRVGSGLCITELSEESPLWETGLRPDDLILGVGGKKINSEEEFAAEVAKAKGFLPLLIERDKIRTFVVVALPVDKKDQPEEKK